MTGQAREEEEEETVESVTPVKTVADWAFPLQVSNRPILFRRT